MKKINPLNQKHYRWILLQLSLRLRSNGRRGTGPPSRQPPDRFCLIIRDNPAAKSARTAFFFWKMGFSVRKMPPGSAYTPPPPIDYWDSEL